VQWTQQLPTVSPPARYGAGMAQYGNGVLLYGGRDAQQFLADTWLWDGTAWTQLPNGPPLSSLPAMATDPMGGVILVHQQQPAPPDTWRFQGGAWSQLPNTIPWGSGNTLALTEESGRVRALVAADQRLERWEWSGTAWQRNAAQVMATQDSSRPAVSPAPGGGLFQWGGTFGTLADRGYVWNGRDWQMLPQVPAPPPRAGHAIAFDARRNSVLLFGGGSSSAQFGDTWEFAAGAWTQSVTTAPTARSGHAMCYDASRGRIVLFGGSQGFTAAADTWLWDGVRWQQAAPATTPPARFQHTMAFDPATGRVWMYGGWRYSPVPVFHADTWTFDGTNWTQVAAAPMVHLAVLGHEPQRGAMMLFEVGGTRAFTWNGGWTAAPAPGEIVQAAALDSGRNRLVLVGLAGAVVELSPGPLPVVGTGSQRCGGPGVDLDLALVGEPLLGGQVRFDLRVPPPIAFLLLADAAGNTMFGPCTVVPALGQATLLVPTPNGAAAIAVSVPDAGSLLGFGVYAQGVALDASSPSGIGLAVTNDVQFVIGW
jgi:hypothetical protein